MYYDLANKSFVATQPFAQGQADRRNSNGDFVQSVPQQIGSLCEKIKQTAILTHVSQRQIESDQTITSEAALTIIGAVLGLLGLSFALVAAILYCRFFNRCSRVCVNPTAKFTSRGGVPCRSKLCNSSVRSSSSNTSNTSTTSADNLTKTHA
ncbi:uncharacterized protein LOC125487712 isoform X2 [Rhincodon typus]|uniref:uncharacterized protein LOC125487712 isoform X2 n=1 Tax=Rhincodon typus TaxID=259920 RepID=UPI00202FD87C|nr:uncharacterized protein LOC125487712 isoform X2 [Rhincodon typus]